MLTDRAGDCPRPLGAPARSDHAAIVVPGHCEVITLELDAPQPFVRVLAEANSSFAVALRDGKAIAGGREITGAATHELAAEGIDTVVVYARGLTAVTWCVQRTDGSDDGWNGVSVVAKLQLPIRPLMPLADEAAELAEARSRLLPDESIDADEFGHLAQLIRGMVVAAGTRRPIDHTLLIKSDQEMDAEEMAALDPLRAVLPHPTWRRALGFSWFDRDPALVPGQRYEYRVSAGFPAADLVDSVYGFHTVPVGTVLPADMFLGELRLRLPQPATVERFDDPGAIGEAVYTRHGIVLTPKRASHWLGPPLDGWSAVIDLPRPTRTVTLDFRGGHTLSYAGGAAWLPWGPATTPVPAGEHVSLSFPTDIHQLRLLGDGFLCAIRIPPDPAAPDGIMLEAARGWTHPAGQHRPPCRAASAASIANLQASQPIATGDVPEAVAPPRQELGFEIRWVPAPIAGVISWPPALPPPPSAATLFQIEHQQTDGAASWTPLVDGDNIITGHRDSSPPVVAAYPGVDLLSLYPEVRAPGAGPGDLVWPDVFDFAVDGAPPRRPPPPPGTHHRYRIRAVDAIGRPGNAWAETSTLRLEKWAPPPLPVGPDDTPAGDLAQPGPSGVHARVLVRDAPDLVAAERSLLGSHQNAVLLRWGWHTGQREQDPYATEFRVYQTRQNPTAIAATVGAVADLGSGRYDVDLTLERAVGTDAARNLRLDAGYPFKILGHGAGTSVTASVVAFVPLANGAYPVPQPGPVQLPVRLTPDRTRAPAWGPRVEVVPIGTAVAYQSAPLFDVLDLTELHPRDEIWLGVSSADDQPYVTDALAPADNRNGNESAIVPIHVEAVYRGRPVVTEVPALDPVPVVVASEPAPRPMEVRLDLAPLLDGTGLAPGERIRLERASDAQVVRAYRVEAGRILARVLEPPRPGDAEAEVVVPNAADRAAILAGLSGGTLSGLDDRFIVYLAASHPYRSRLYQAAIESAVTLPVVIDVLPNAGARYVYRARRVDAAGNLSADGVTLRGVVRVPSMATVATPLREPGMPQDPETRVRFLVDGGVDVTHLLVFHHELPGAAPKELPELIRVPSAPWLAPADRAKLRLADGALLAGAVVDLAPAAPGERRTGVIADVPVTAGARARVWACAMTRDGVTSALAGPFTVSRQPLPVSAPTLAVTGNRPDLTLSWTWPSPDDATQAVVEWSSDGTHFERVSPPLPPPLGTTGFRAPAGPGFVRLHARRRDGGAAVSNTVEI